MADDPQFVIQHHLATADHYDFRLEIDGVLVSWAVPKGPSNDPHDRRLAKRTGDHDLDYASFEGTIGHGRPGGGVVQVWDVGTFQNVSERDGAHLAARDALARGHLSFILAGHKLRGRYSLIKTRGEDVWLLLKKRDTDTDTDTGERGHPIIDRTESVLTGRTLEQIAADGPS